MILEDLNQAYSYTKAAIAKNFNRAANSYQENAILQKVVGERLFERLDLVLIEPEIIVDLGCGTGFFSRQLQQRYKKKKVYGIDLAWQMNDNANKQRKWRSKERYICADAEKLPFADNSVDLIFSNLMMQWVLDPDPLFQEIQRVLVPGGLLMFAGLGPDTLKEMRHSWQQVDNHVHVNRFLDMHDIGDSLTNSGFAGIVMDNEQLTMTYEDLTDLHQDLRNTGETNINLGRNPNITSKKQWNQYIAAYKTWLNNKQEYPATWEIAYGHAWATEKMPARKMDAESDVHPFTVQEFRR